MSNCYDSECWALTTALLLLSALNFSNTSSRYITSLPRYNVLRDNLPPALETQTSQEELTYVADSIERKLYQTASSPRAYCALGTLELRITALATAVLIHSDRGQEDYNGYQVVSDTCARLSAAARRSLVYCVMVLISYEKRNLDKPIQQRRMAKMEKKKNLGYLQGQEGYLQGQEGSSTNEMMKEMYSQYAAEYHLHQQAECPSFDGNPHRAEYCQFEKMTPSASIDHSAGDDLDNRGDSEQVQPFPPSA